MIIYIASPYTIGDVAENVSRQIAAAHHILDMDHCPIAPLLSHYLHIYKQRPYKDWMDMDMALIKRCDILLRLPGKSSGADEEVEFANSLKIPVAFGFEDLPATINALKFLTNSQEDT